MSIVKRAIMAYMGARCDVSSQHKLPGREELYSTVTIGFLFTKHQIDSAVDDLVAEKRLLTYGPYISDHVIDVL
jgi:hypothetical protein